MKKVVLVGTGAVGTAYAYSVINQGTVNELVLIDANEARAEGEAMDLIHGMAFAPTNTKVSAGTYADCANADIVVITAGANQKPGETRLDLVEKNTKIIKAITKDVVDSGFSGIFLIATNPVDILSYVVQRESGFAPHRVIGSGTSLDTARFKVLLGEYFDIDPHNVHALIVGEHGDSELPVWSQASIGAESLENLLKRRNNPEDEQQLEQIFVQVRDAAYEIIKRKGMTDFGIGMCLARITKAIFNDEHSIIPVSCLLDGQYGESDIYLSVPAVIYQDGVKEMIELSLSDLEQEKFKKSAHKVRSSMK